MKSRFFNYLLFAGFFFPLQFFAQTIPDVSFDYRFHEQQAAEKRLAFLPNPNTLNYDLTYQKLELDVNPAQYFIGGRVTTQFIPNEDMQSIVFDLSHQLQVTEVLQENQPLAFSQADNELTIQLAATVISGTQGEVQITYSGIPPTDNEAFTQSQHAGTPIIWTLSEPFGARDWWPCKQSLNDKIDSMDIYLKTPADMVAVANGMEQSQITHDDGTKTTHFKHRYPIPAYLVAIAVTNYEIFEQTAGTAPYTFPIINYLYPETYQSAVSQLAVTLPIMDIFEELFGTYPFHTEKYGHAQFGWGGGMEHTTVSFMGGFSRHLIAHELAHHWFGNKVTCGSWKDIWINEGFAEYMAGLVVEHLDGEEAFINWKKGKVERVTSQSDGNLYLSDAQALDSNRIFNGRITYDKGSMVVHMLRYVLGDEVFYEAMRNFLDDPGIAYDYAVTPQVQQHLEAVSGKDLTEFFNDWIYGEGYPSYQVNAETLSATHTRILLSQTTSHESVPFFEMPVTMQFIGEDHQSEIVVLNHTQNHQGFIVETGIGTVKEIIINPFNDIICKDNQVHLTEGEKLKNDEIIVFPNPASTSFQVIFPENIADYSMCLYDVKGRLVARDIENPHTVEHLLEGMYILSIETPEKTYHKKVLKN